MEQIVVRNLPAGTKAALRKRAQSRHSSVEAQLRRIIAEALAAQPATMADLLASDAGADIEFDPGRLGLGMRSVEL